MAEEDLFYKILSGVFGIIVFFLKLFYELIVNTLKFMFSAFKGVKP